jgi:hypothetical protein
VTSAEPTPKQTATTASLNDTVAPWFDIDADGPCSGCGECRPWSRPWPEEVHQLVEFEVDRAYADGYRDGYAAASKAVNNAIASATQGLPLSAQEIVARLVRLPARAGVSA